MNILIQQSIAAGAQINLMQGQQYEFLPMDSNVQIGVVGAADGLVLTVFAGADLVQQEGPCPTQTNFPSVQDGLYINENIAGGTRLSLLVRNTTGAAIVARAVVRMLGL